MNKLSVAIVGILTVVLIISVGWITLSAISNSLDTSDATMQNTTSAIGSSNTIYGVSGMILMIAVIVGLSIGMSYFVSSQQRFDRLGKVLEFLIDSVYYFAYGLLAITVIVVPGYLVYLLYNYAVLDGHGGNVLDVLKWVALITISFFAISGIGYVFKKKIIDKYLKIKESKESKKELVNA